MVATKAFLGTMGAAWTGYGAYCFIDPHVLETMAGMKLDERTTHWGFVPELRAMYGGAQIGLGLFALFTLRSLLAPNNAETKRVRAATALRAFGWVMGSLGVARVAAVVAAGQSLKPAVSLAVFTQGISVLLPEHYNANAAWLFELPWAAAGHILAWAVEREEDGDGDDDHAVRGKPKTR